MINVAVIRNDSILLVKKGGVWILPNGNPEAGETDIACLHREITREKLPYSKLSAYRIYSTFDCQDSHGKSFFTARVYFASIEGMITPGAKIDEAVWTSGPEKLNLSDMTKKIIISLKKNNYLQGGVLA